MPDIRFPLPHVVELGYGQTAIKCQHCDFDYMMTPGFTPNALCEHCDGGYVGVDGRKPTTCKPGTQGKIVMMRIRDSQGLVTRNPDDATGQANESELRIKGYQRTTKRTHECAKDRREAEEELMEMFVA